MTRTNNRARGRGSPRGRSNNRDGCLQRGSSPYRGPSRGGPPNRGGLPSRGGSPNRGLNRGGLPNRSNFRGPRSRNPNSQPSSSNTIQKPSQPCSSTLSQESSTTPTTVKLEEQLNFKIKPDFSKGPVEVKNELKVITDEENSSSVKESVTIKSEPVSPEINIRSERESFSIKGELLEIAPQDIKREPESPSEIIVEQEQKLPEIKEPVTIENETKSVKSLVLAAKTSPISKVLTGAIPTTPVKGSTIKKSMQKSKTGISPKKIIKKVTGSSSNVTPTTPLKGILCNPKSRTRAFKQELIDEIKSINDTFNTLSSNGSSNITGNSSNTTDITDTPVATTAAATGSSSNTTETADTSAAAAATAATTTTTITTTTTTTTISGSTIEDSLSYVVDCIGSTVDDSFQEMESEEDVKLILKSSDSEEEIDEANSNGTSISTTKEEKLEETKENKPMELIKGEIELETFMEINKMEIIGKKRKRKNPDGNQIKRKRVYDQSGSAVSKNPLMKLNELKPGLIYVVDSQEGPSHNPTFIVSVEVNNQKYSGSGRSKQDAKHSAALSALASFVQFPDQSEISQMMPRASIKGHDFTSDAMDVETSSFNRMPTIKEEFVNLTCSEYMTAPKKSKIIKALTDFEKKSPVMLLNELHPGCEFILADEMSSVPAHRFTMTVTINGEFFEGSGQSKKLAKAAAARSALLELYEIPFGGNLNNVFETMDTGVGAISSSSLKQGIADKIANTVYERFNEIIVGFDENKKWKVLAGIVMTSDDNMENISVIGLSTGTKCISGEHISLNGASLNDCHAEILSRRCFKDYIYKQIEMHLEGEGDYSILLRQDIGGFKLKPDVKFHLFISTAPCGDARIFSPHEIEFEDGGIDKHPNRKGRGLLRTKIEAGEGTIPIKVNEAFQTWDGIQGGQRLLTMSCSDKISRWNILGLQGTLLSLFVEPIYLESIILGSLYHEDHLSRAMGRRIEATLEKLPRPYQLNIPKLNLVSSVETRQPSKSPTFSVNWSHGLIKPEIVNGTTGKLHNGQPSRLAKRAFFYRFLKLREQVCFLPGKEFQKFQNYSETKKQVQDYKIAKEAVLKAFFNANLGNWVKKPPEQDEFVMEVI